MKLLKSKKIKLIKAKKKDSIFFYNLRNSKQIKKISTNTNNISYFKHKIWFKKSIINKNYFFFLIEFLKKNIGYIRLKKKDINTFIISIALNKSYINKGIGSLSIKCVEKKFKNYNFIAKVKKTNKISYKFFKKNGYTKISNEKNFFIMGKKNKIHSKTIDKIENVRAKNNVNWMDILRIAYKYSPRETVNIMKKIYVSDKKISQLVKTLLR